ncbi:uncharacterized protein MONBRDRAFT_39240 [Monosiga brevicollis MX1]|uniref:Annexin n=1 Tax=Monosiga brevicollis TaxID=81824 RepID=A9VD41_MONBE|nr:uncharacterized protein MONBRDRAFT_39240 [Monosiga brevicollis MX1]EDQ84614.1 predicted protein [Monosiga brevicollis MX1]|eukprot:XP_001750641.1 hypothetical protein [Monosiga brevicollis MX1]
MQALRKAMKGLGCNERAVIEVLCSVDNAQRQQLKVQYKTMFGRDLVDDLKSELGGNLERAVLAMMMPPAEYDAFSLHEAMKGAGTDEADITEILATRSNAEIAAIKAAYEKAYHKDLEKAISSENGGHLKRIYISLLQANRDETDKVDQALASEDAKALFDAGEKRWGTDESEFNRIFMSRSAAQIKGLSPSIPLLHVPFSTADEYAKISDYGLRRAIEKEMSGNYEFAMVSMLQAAVDMPGYFAERAYRAMKGFGTADADLIRVIVTRSEKDLEVVKQRFHELYHKKLSKMVEGDCSGDYKRLLLHIIGE